MDVDFSKIVEGCYTWQNFYITSFLCGAYGILLVIGYIIDKEWKTAFYVALACIVVGCLLFALLPLICLLAELLLVFLYGVMALIGIALIGLVLYGVVFLVRKL